MGENQLMDSVRSKYTIHEETEAFLELYGKISKNPTELTVDDVRSTESELSRQTTEEVDYNGRVWDINVPALAVQGGIPVTIYKPVVDKLNHKPAIVVYFHGGGFISGSRTSCDYTCRVMSRDAECIVVNVEYRLAPEHKLPAAFDDGVSVVRYVMMNKSLIGGELQSRVGLAGNGVGGLIATEVSHILSGINYQVLIYPVIDVSFKQPSWKEFEKGPIVSQSDIEWRIKQCVPEDNDAVLKRLSPLQKDNSAKVPPTMILVAELDPTRDSTQEYTRKLKAAGVKAESFMVKGVPHNFMSAPGAFKKCYKSSMDKLCQFIARHSESHTVKLLT